MLSRSRRSSLRPTSASMKSIDPRLISPSGERRTDAKRRRSPSVQPPRAMLRKRAISTVPSVTKRRLGRPRVGNRRTRSLHVGSESGQEGQWECGSTPLGARPDFNLSRVRPCHGRHEYSKGSGADTDPFFSQTLWSLEDASVTRTVTKLSRPSSILGSRRSTYDHETRHRGVLSGPWWTVTVEVALRWIVCPLRRTPLIPMQF